MREALPLTVKTPDSWAEIALADPLQLLNDHAHLEKKAVTNVLELLPRWPAGKKSSRWVRVLSAIARDEVSHLATVSRLIETYGGEMSKKHKSEYAVMLRELVRSGGGDKELIDRLLISALLELRSCERFEILSRLCRDHKLAKLYRALWASEHGHYRIFIELAKSVGSIKEIDTRWREVLRAEGVIIKKQRVGSSIHSWVE